MSDRDAAASLNSSVRSSREQSYRSTEIDVLLPRGRNVRPVGCTSRKQGMGVGSSAGFVLITILFTIAMPYAATQTGLIGGVVYLIAMPLLMVYMAILAGRSWVMLMEKWPEKYSEQRVRRPFAAVAKEAGGRFWEIFTQVSLDFTNLGGAIVLLLACASTLEVLIPGQFSDRVLAVFVAVLVMPIICLGTPMDSWFIGWIGGFVALLTSTMLLVAVAMSSVYTADVRESDHLFTNSSTLSPTTHMTGAAAWTAQSYDDVYSGAVGRPLAHDGGVSFTSFWIGASSMTFAFSIVAMSPTLQHDMRSPSRLPHALIPPFAICILLSLALAVVGSQTFGSTSNPNILKNVQCRSSHSIHVMTKITSALYALYNFFNCLLSLIPVTQNMEEVFKLPLDRTTYKHILVRCGTVLLTLALGVSMPHFHKYASLIGASSMVLNNFVFPPLFYYWLMKAQGVLFNRAEIALLVMVLTINIVSGLAGTYAAVVGIIAKPVADPC